VHPFLEHLDSLAAELPGDGQPGVQPPLLKERKRTSKHAWVQSKPNNSVEVPFDEEAGHSHGAHLQSAVSFGQSRRLDPGDWSRGRDATVLERLPPSEAAEDSEFDDKPLSKGPSVSERL